LGIGGEAGPEVAGLGIGGGSAPFAEMSIFAPGFASAFIVATRSSFFFCLAIILSTSPPHMLQNFESDSRGA
jgi:hypothetical protein